MNQVPRRRSQLYLLVVLFFGPLAAAIVLYFVVPEWQPQGRTNYGQLINPARPAPDVRLIGIDGKAAGGEVLRGRWTYLYLGDARCAQGCTDTLYQFRQIRTLLNDKRSRVRRVYLAPDVALLPALQQQLGATHPDLELYAPDREDQGLRDFLQAPGTSAGAAQAVYLLDPLGNWLMVYPPDSDSKGVLRDIKKLLSASQIDR